jgi:hypothetical protein
VAAEPIARFLHEETITPGQIGDYKIGLREACIAALSEPR